MINTVNFFNAVFFMYTVQSHKRFQKKVDDEEAACSNQRSIHRIRSRSRPLTGQQPTTVDAMARMAMMYVKQTSISVVRLNFENEWFTRALVLLYLCRHVLRRNLVKYADSHEKMAMRSVNKSFIAMDEILQEFFDS